MSDVDKFTGAALTVVASALLLKLFGKKLKIVNERKSKERKLFKAYNNRFFK